MQTVRKPYQGRRRGYTLLEVLIVVAIIAVIAAMVVPNLLRNLSSSRERVTQAEITSIENTFKLYRVDHPAYPSGGSEVFQQLILPETDPRTGKQLPPVFEELPEDGWGQPFNYEYPTSRFTTGIDKPAIWSNGENNQNDNGDGDDINNWASATQTQ
jgi:general secretion pathway protein G